MPFRMLKAENISILSTIREKLMNNRVLEFEDGKLVHIETFDKNGRVLRSFGHTLTEAIEKFNNRFSQSF